MIDHIILLLDLAGTLIFAATGAIRGVKTHLDIFGVTVLACCVGVGGGIGRDLIIGAVPVAAMQDQNYILICIITALVTFALPKRALAHPGIIKILDAFGLGVFTALGAAKAAMYDMNTTGIILCGIITATGGGVIRDVLSHRLPPTVLKTDFYATAALIGGALFCVLKYFHIPAGWLFFITASSVTVIRMLAMYFKLKLPAK
ncbi:MAG: trimeric intracellular cation channel family protein [Lentisphaeria bacterium]|nr:trimeric intracellular cation channel family protein [Lentisphaeria bacterium]